MQLMKVGDRYMNMDLLIGAERSRKGSAAKSIVLTFAASTNGTDEPYSVHLAGDAAAEAIDWLEASVSDPIVEQLAMSPYIDQACRDTVVDTEQALASSPFDDAAFVQLQGAILLAMDCTQRETFDIVQWMIRDSAAGVPWPREFKFFMKRAREILAAIRHGALSLTTLPRVAANDQL